MKIFPVLFQRVPWGKFLLLWFLAVLMGTSLLWLHYGFTPKILGPVEILVLASALGLLWGTTRPRWQKAHCAWCGNRVKAHATRFDEVRKNWVMVYRCGKCGQITEKLKSETDTTPFGRPPHGYKDIKGKGGKNG